MGGETGSPWEKRSHDHGGARDSNTSSEYHQNGEEHVAMSRGGSEERVVRLSGVEEDILTLLVGRELYGLAILEASRTAVGDTRALRPGSLYTALAKLEHKGLVRSWWGEERPPERGGARRRYYTATGLGAEVLTATQLRRMQLAAWQPA